MIQIQRVRILSVTVRNFIDHTGQVVLHSFYKNVYFSSLLRSRPFLGSSRNAPPHMRDKPKNGCVGDY